MTNNPETVVESPDFMRFKENSPDDLEALQWLQTIQNVSVTNEPLRTFYIEGLQVDCWSDSPGEIEWLSKFLYPLAHSKAQQENKEQFKVGSFFSDSLIVEIARFIDSGVMDCQHIQSNKGVVTRFVFNTHLILDFDPVVGTACLTDLEKRSITLVTSCHTERQVKHLARCVRDLVTGFLRDNDWHTFHAGAFQTPDGIFMVIGDQGAGKTSLLLAMMYSGAQFIANDRIFIKEIDGKPHLLSFPMSVAIGLGTALQYASLKHYITNPVSLAYPTIRMDLKKILSEPESKWHELPDKVQIFPSELERDFSCERSVSGGEIKGVIFPTISDQTYLGMQAMHRNHAKSIITNNLFPWQTDAVVPPWRPLDYGNPAVGSETSLINNLLSLPLVDLHYFACKSRMNEVKEYRHVLSDFLRYNSA